MPPTYLQPPPDFLAGYRAQQQLSENQMNQRAAYAAAIAEQLGRYTPELQRQVLAPLGEYPTVGEYLFSSPVRGLGKLMGNQKMQQYGAPKEFQLTGQPEAPLIMPKIPEGVPPDMRAFIENYVSQNQRKIIPNMPSEYSTSTPMMKTKTEREREAAVQTNVFNMIKDAYQSQQEQDMKKAQIANYNAQVEHFKNLNDEIQDKIKRGPTQSEWTTLNDIFKEHPEMDKIDVMRNFFDAVNSGKVSAQTAEIQLFNLAQRQGYKGNIAQFRTTMKVANGDPARITYEAAMQDPFFWIKYKTPEERMGELQRRTLEYTQLMNAMGTGEYGALAPGWEEGVKAPSGKTGPKAPGGNKYGGWGKSSVSGAWSLEQMKPGSYAPNTKLNLPTELKSMGVTDQDITNLIKEEALKGRKLNETQAIEMYMNYYRSIAKQGR